MEENFIEIHTRAVIFNENDEILVEHSLRPENDCYYLPGGGVWHREKLVDCLVREVKEETGLDVSVDRLLWIRDFLESYSGHSIEIFFLATNNGGEFRPVHDTEPLEFSFMPPEELDKLIFYPKSLVKRLEILGHDRDWREEDLYLRSIE
jgi:ADP-ribose pyrophosphatase YjhB (NUDIX family)